MSDNYLTVIPADPYRRPDEDATERAVDALSRMLPDDDARRGLEAKWHDDVEVVWCGSDLKRISCPHCGAECGPGCWADAVTERHDEGFPTLTNILGHPLRQILIHIWRRDPAGSPV